MAIWYSLWSFVIFFPIWNVWTKKNKSGNPVHRRAQKDDEKMAATFELKKTQAKKERVALSKNDAF
jgi:hypothetical protein